LPELNLAWTKSGFILNVQQKWLSKNPLTQAELNSEVGLWKDINIDLEII
jgi:hypothetical protein